MVISFLLNMQCPFWGQWCTCRPLPHLNDWLTTYTFSLYSLYWTVLLALWTLDKCSMFLHNIDNHPPNNSVKPQKTQSLCFSQDNHPSPLLDPPNPHSLSNFLFCTTKYFSFPTLPVFLPSVAVTVSCSLLLFAPLTNGPVFWVPPPMSLCILSFPPCWSWSCTLIQPAPILHPLLTSLTKCLKNWNQLEQSLISYKGMRLKLQLWRASATNELPQRNGPQYHPEITQVNQIKAVYVNLRQQINTSRLLIGSSHYITYKITTQNQTDNNHKNRENR